MIREWTAQEYPLIFGADGRRFCRYPDGRLLEVDLDMIHEMACDGSLFGENEDSLQFVRYLCGPAEDD